MTTQDLIELLEKAEGPSRKLDAAVWLAVMDPAHLPDVGFGRRGHSVDCAWKPNQSPSGCDCGADKWNNSAPTVRGFLYNPGDHDYAASMVGQYTASIDAKLPDEDIVSVIRHEDGWYADEATGSVGHHPTSEAIARRIAALRARKGEVSS